MINAPVALILFNRPQHTARVFERIAAARPQKLFLIADGPRADRPDDREKCAQARALVERIDWDCDVRRAYSDINLGCGVRPATGIRWVFEQVERCIILEDDCVPDSSFFSYCSELLEHYANDERVMTISGRNHLPRSASAPFSYHFTLFPNCWGWATWRRAWRLYDFNIPQWRDLRHSEWLADLLREPQAVEYWAPLFDKACDAGPGLDYWDHQWSFTCWSQHGLSIAPNVNLIQNVGFGSDATHTRSAADYRANAQAGTMASPLRHPPYVARDVHADRQRLELLFSRKKGRRDPLGRRLSKLLGLN